MSIFVEVARGTYSNAWVDGNAGDCIKACRAQPDPYPGYGCYYCTREVGHTGVHVAHTFSSGNVVYKAWLDDDPDMKMDEGL